MKLFRDQYRSICCNAPIRIVSGLTDFIGDTEEEANKYPRTCSFICTLCDKPCDIKEVTNASNSSTISDIDTGGGGSTL